MSGGKITEHARLFETSNLQNAVQAAAVWQVASVVVAQKHLADINQKLDALKVGIDAVTAHLDEQRKSRLRATYDYLCQVYSAIQGGEMSSALRVQLEKCEHDLLEIQYHLEVECRRKLAKKVEHSEMAGSEDLSNDIRRKIDDLNDLSSDIVACIKTRVAAWHVLSLIPGESQLKLARRNQISESIDRLKTMTPLIREGLDVEILSVDSFWNKKSTLIERREALQRKSNELANWLTQDSDRCLEQVIQTEALLLAHDQPSRYLFQIENGQVVETRLSA